MNFMSDGRYYVIQQDDLANLTEEVREYMRNGWTPTGGISTDSRRFYQAMITTDAAFEAATLHWHKVVAAEMVKIDEERQNLLGDDLILAALNRLGDKVPKNYVSDGVNVHFQLVKKNGPFDISKLAQDPK